MKISGIYKIQSVVKPERIYIGSAVDIKRRRYEHLSDLRLKRHGSLKLQRHFDKYGTEDLVFTTVLVCEKFLLIQNEQFFIDSYDPYFNCCKTAGSPLGRKLSEETKIKIGLANKGNKYCLGKHHTEETKKLISGAAKGHKRGLGKKFSEETKRKISEFHKGNTYAKGHKPWLGKTHTEETKTKMSLSRIGIKYSDETKEKIAAGARGNHYALGYKHTEEEKQKMRDAAAARKLRLAI